MASQVTPLAISFSAKPLSEPLVCDALTKGHPGLNHSSTTVLPRYVLRRIFFPSRSGNSKSGAGWPTSARPSTMAAVACEGATAAAGVATAPGVLACGSGLAGERAQLAPARERASEAT